MVLLFYGSCAFSELKSTSNKLSKKHTLKFQFLMSKAFFWRNFMSNYQKSTCLNWTYGLFYRFIKLFCFLHCTKLNRKYHTEFDINRIILTCQYWRIKKANVWNRHPVFLVINTELLWFIKFTYFLVKFEIDITILTSLN